MQKKIIVLDDGHGEGTAGKRSPEWDKGILFENEFNEDIMLRIAKILQAAGIKVFFTAPEKEDVSLEKRAKRVNDLYNQYPEQVILISIHANAGGGEGYELFTSKGQTKSDEYAKMIFDEVKAQFPEWRMRGIKEENFYLLKKTMCPAVLCELGFMDNKADYDRLMNNEFRNRLAIAHANAIIKIASRP